MGVRKTGFYKHVLVQNVGLMLGRLVDKYISTMTSQEDLGLEDAHWGRRGPLWLDKQEGAQEGGHPEEVGSGARGWARPPFGMPLWC